MTPRKRLKYWIYGARGQFPYFGTAVHFPSGASGFKAACEQGIFEATNVRLLLGICRPGSHMFDVGANLGLMAIPVLKSIQGCVVISFEPSPNSLPWLRRTLASSGYGERWRLIEKAAGTAPHTAEFSLSRPDQGLYDGLKPTGRIPEVKKVKVDVTTLDIEWKNLGRPPVSAIKIDVEGAELDVIHGAAECLKETRPPILLEWNATNLAAYRVEPASILDTAEINGYRLYALPSIVLIRTAAELSLHMITTESFLLMPSASDELPC